MSNSCHLCSQIEGQEDNDLIARMLPGEPYIQRIMMESPSFAVIPSLGPLSPGHSLLCPKAHLTSFAQVDIPLYTEYLTIKEALRIKLRLLYHTEVTIFEHGMSNTRDRILCSVEHAHLHFIPLPENYDVDDSVRFSDWIEFDGQLTTLKQLTGGHEYVFYESPEGVCRLLPSRHRKVEPQFMRQVIAEGLGRAHYWNWKENPDAYAADQAWRRFTQTEPVYQ